MDLYIAGKHPAWRDFVDPARLPRVPAGLKRFDREHRPALESFYSRAEHPARLVLWQEGSRSALVLILPSRDMPNASSGVSRRSALFVGMYASAGGLVRLITKAISSLAPLAERLSDPSLTQAEFLKLTAEGDRAHHQGEAARHNLVALLESAAARVTGCTLKRFTATSGSRPLGFHIDASPPSILLPAALTRAMSSTAPPKPNGAMLTRPKPVTSNGLHKPQLAAATATPTPPRAKIEPIMELAAEPVKQPALAERAVEVVATLSQWPAEIEVDDQPQRGAQRDSRFELAERSSEQTSDFGEDAVALPAADRVVESGEAWVQDAPQAVTVAQVNEAPHEEQLVEAQQHYPVETETAEPLSTSSQAATAVEGLRKTWAEEDAEPTTAPAYENRATETSDEPTPDPGGADHEPAPTPAAVAEASEQAVDVSGAGEPVAALDVWLIEDLPAATVREPCVAESDDCHLATEDLALPTREPEAATESSVVISMPPDLFIDLELAAALPSPQSAELETTQRTTPLEALTEADSPSDFHDHDVSSALKPLEPEPDLALLADEPAADDSKQTSPEVHHEEPAGDDRFESDTTVQIQDYLTIGAYEPQSLLQTLVQPASSRQEPDQVEEEVISAASPPEPHRPRAILELIDAEVAGEANDAGEREAVHGLLTYLPEEQDDPQGMIWLAEPSTNTEHSPEVLIDEQPELVPVVEARQNLVELVEERADVAEILEDRSLFPAATEERAAPACAVEERLEPAAPVEQQRYFSAEVTDSAEPAEAVDEQRQLPPAVEELPNVSMALAEPVEPAALLEPVAPAAPPEPVEAAAPPEPAENAWPVGEGFRSSLVVESSEAVASIEADLRCSAAAPEQAPALAAEEWARATDAIDEPTEPAEAEPGERKAAAVIEDQSVDARQFSEAPVAPTEPSATEYAEAPEVGQGESPPAAEHPRAGVAIDWPQELRGPAASQAAAVDAAEQSVTRHRQPPEREALHAVHAVQLPRRAVVPVGSAVCFSSATGNVISLSPTRSRKTQLCVRLCAHRGVVRLACDTSLTFSIGAASDHVLLEFTGSEAAVNAAMEGLRFTPSLTRPQGASLRIQTFVDPRRRMQPDIDVTIPIVVDDAPGESE